MAFEAFTAHNLPEGVEPTLSGESTVDPLDFSYPHGTHLAAMEVDKKAGGKARAMSTLTVQAEALNSVLKRKEAEIEAELSEEDRLFAQAEGEARDA